ncbi:hypothetical protein HDU76_009108 [Blyttiomyces sp. JEL0837]|nr:hypothetical protein HDU76_009108 [Blyttiomyces sp. JEL0837]
MNPNSLSTFINPATNMGKAHLVGHNAITIMPSPPSSILSNSNTRPSVGSYSAPNVPSRSNTNVRKQGVPHRSISREDVINPAKEIITLDFTTCLLSTPQKLLATFGEPPRSKKRKSPTRRSTQLKQLKNDNIGSVALRQVKSSSVQKTGIKTTAVVPIPRTMVTRRSKLRVQADADGSSEEVMMGEVEQQVEVAAGSVKGNEKVEEQVVAVGGANVVRIDDGIHVGGDGQKTDEKPSKQSKSKKRAREEDEEEDGCKGVNKQTRAVAQVRRGGKKVKVA